MKDEDLVKILRQRVDQAGSASALSREIGIPVSRISEALAGKGVVTSLAYALGFEKATVFLPKK